MQVYGDGVPDQAKYLHYHRSGDGLATLAIAGPLLGPAFDSLLERKNIVVTFARFSGKVITLYSKIHNYRWIILS